MHHHAIGKPAPQGKTIGFHCARSVASGPSGRKRDRAARPGPAAAARGDWRRPRKAHRPPLQHRRMVLEIRGRLARGLGAFVPESYLDDGFQVGVAAEGAHFSGARVSGPGALPRSQMAWSRIAAPSPGRAVAIKHGYWPVWPVPGHPHRPNSPAGTLPREIQLPCRYRHGSVQNLSPWACSDGGPGDLHGAEIGLVTQGRRD